MCAGNDALLRVGPFIIARRYIYRPGGKFPQRPGLFNAQYMTRKPRIASIPPKAMR